MTLHVGQLRAFMSEAKQQRQAILDDLERLELRLISAVDVSRKHVGELQNLERAVRGGETQAEQQGHRQRRQKQVGK